MTTNIWDSISHQFLTAEYAEQVHINQLGWKKETVISGAQENMPQLEEKLISPNTANNQFLYCCLLSRYSIEKTVLLIFPIRAINAGKYLRTKSNQNYSLQLSDIASSISTQYLYISIQYLYSTLEHILQELPMDGPSFQGLFTMNFY